MPVDDGQSIRAQSKKSKSQGINDKSGNRDIIKPVLANPLTVPWPTLPKHLQTASFHALKQLIPDDIPAYHTSRDRCHKKDRRQERSKKAREEVRLKNEGRGVLTKDPAGRGVEAAAQAGDTDLADSKAGSTESTSAAAGDKRALPSTTSDSTHPASKRQKTLPTESNDPAPIPTHPPNDQTPHTRPEPPASLQHLVFGINETVKALERQTDQLRVRIMQLGEAIEAHEGESKRDGNRGAVRGADGKEKGAGRGEEGSGLRLEEEDLAVSNAAKLGADRIPADVGVQASMAGATKESNTPLENDVAPAGSVRVAPHSGISSPTSSSVNPEPIEYILIPLPDLNPPTLAAHIPPYCATHNTLVYQFKHLWKIARARLPAWRLEEVLEVMGLERKNEGAGSDVTGEAGQVDEVDEVRVVPLGRVQAELSGSVGLRRVACVGVRTSHPDISTLRALLPKSSLKPPRYSLTLPFLIPTSKLAIHDKPLSNRAKHAQGQESTKNAKLVPTAPSVADCASTDEDVQAVDPARTAESASKARVATATAVAKASKTPALMPHIHYAPLHVKGLTTTVPADGSARKAKRMEEVRTKRKEKKERKEMRRVM